MHLTVAAWMVTTRRVQFPPKYSTGCCQTTEDCFILILREIKRNKEVVLGELDEIASSATFPHTSEALPSTTKGYANTIESLYH